MWKVEFQYWTKAHAHVQWEWSFRCGVDTRTIDIAVFLSIPLLLVYTPPHRQWAPVWKNCMCPTSNFHGWDCFGNWTESLEFHKMPFLHVSAPRGVEMELQVPQPRSQAFRGGRRETGHYKFHGYSTLIKSCLLHKLVPSTYRLLTLIFCLQLSPLQTMYIGLNNTQSYRLGRAWGTSLE